MSGLHFEEEMAPITEADPLRADVALFVGFVPLRGAEASFVLPEALADWLSKRELLAREGRPVSKHLVRRGAPVLRDVPVPLRSWDEFDRLFDGEHDEAGRPVRTPLRDAVRAFFMQGGRRAIVVRVGDRPDADLPDALRRLGLPADPANPVLREDPPDPERPETWQGVGYLLGLREVSFLNLPDLPYLVRTAPPDPPERKGPVEKPFFRPCDLRPNAGLERWVFRPGEPRANEAGYETWVGALTHIVAMLRRDAREVQLVAAIPLPHPEAEFAREPARILTRWLGGRDAARSAEPGEKTGLLASAFLQLVYPWVQLPGAEAPLMAPDGVAVGRLARNALGQGAFRSAAGAALVGVAGFEPELQAADRQLRVGDAPWIERVSLLGRTPFGPQLLSDATTALDPGWRYGSAQRLMSLLRRKARMVGESVAFDGSSEELWGRLRVTLEDVLSALHRAGGLRGARAGDAFEVRCDRTTMTQRDIDGGRVIAEVRFQAAAPIHTLTVTLDLGSDGRVDLLGRDRRIEKAA